MVHVQRDCDVRWKKSASSYLLTYLLQLRKVDARKPMYVPASIVHSIADKQSVT